MSAGLAHLALEVKFLDRAQRFYEDRLGLEPERTGDHETAFQVGDTILILRRPDAVPRGGIHVHYAFEAPAPHYRSWQDRLADLDPEEVSFGSYQSLYVDDPDGHCVEVGNNGPEQPADLSRSGPRLTGVFEVVLEVAELDRARRVYETLGFDVVDRGNERRRLRMKGPADGGDPFDLELWEPHLGLADARGGVHVDLGLRVSDVSKTASRAGAEVTGVRRIETGTKAVQLVDPDNHRIRLEPA